MEGFAQENAVHGVRALLGGAVVILPLVFVALVPCMESAVHVIGGVVHFSFPPF